MPLLDHFHPPLSEERHWEGFHSKWANALVDHLNETLLPPGFFAEPHVHRGALVEVDAATFQSRSTAVIEGGTVTLPVRAWSPPAPSFAMPAIVPDTFEVRVINTEAGPTLVAAIEFIGPSNKDRAEARRAFAIKGASYLCQGVSLLIIDVVTSRRANLHDEVIGLLPNSDAFGFPGSPHLYTSAYRPVQRDEKENIDVWLMPLVVGQALPVMPLGLTSELVLPINLEITYTDARRKLRMVG